jgi:hypothetical protein
LHSLSECFSVKQEHSKSSEPANNQGRHHKDGLAEETLEPKDADMRSDSSEYCTKEVNIFKILFHTIHMMLKVKNFKTASK